MALGSEAASSAAKDVTADIFIASMGKAASGRAFQLARELRANGVSCDIDFENRSLKSQMRSAELDEGGHVFIIGDDELAQRRGDIAEHEDKRAGRRQVPGDSRED